jgi:membrane protein implicated in regulation of membrane protease activity
MASQRKWLIAGIIFVIGLILFAVNEYLAIALIVVAIGVPATAYFMLDKSQRRRLREIRRRQVGR